jgi:LysR family transcriptional regulator for metE and metH
LKQYRVAHPQIDVRIDATATANPLVHLLDGRLDLAIVSDPVRDRRIVTTPLFDDEVFVVVHPRHRPAGKAVVRPEDLAGETLLTYSPKEESTLYQRYLLPAGVNVDVQPVQLTEALIELVKAGLGVAALARCAIRSGGSQWCGARGAVYAAGLQTHLERGDAEGRGPSAPRPGLHSVGRQAPTVFAGGAPAGSCPSQGPEPRPLARRLVDECL